MAFARAASRGQVDETGVLPVTIDGHPVCLVQVEDDVRAIYDVCSHQEYPLHEGMVWGRSIECALHGSTFSLDDGSPESLPATVPVPVFATKVDGDDVYVDLDQQLNDAPIPDHF